MVRKKKTRTRRCNGPLTDGQLSLLCRGGTWGWGEGTQPFFANGSTPDPGLIESLWRDVRDELLPAFVARFPGYRPYAWWIAEAPEPARRITGGTMERGPLAFGVSQFLARVDDSTTGARLETQAAFLDRHGLLGNEERQALGDFAKEESFHAAQAPCGCEYTRPEIDYPAAT